MNTKNFISTIIKLGKPPKVVFAFALLISIGSAVAGLVTPLLTRDIIDGGLTNFSIAFALLIIGVFVLQALLSGVSFYMMTYIGNKVILNMRKTLFRKLIYLPYSFFSNTMSGEVSSRMTNDTLILRDLVAERLISFITGIISIIAAVVILLFIDWQMTLMILLAIPLTAIIIVPLGRKMSKITKKTQEQTADFNGAITQVFSEMRLVKSSNGEADELIKKEVLLKDIFKLYLKEGKIFAIMMPVMQGFIILVLFGIVAYGGMRVSDGSLSSGTLIAFVLYMFQIIMPVVQMGVFFTQVAKAKGATERIIDILAEQDEALDKGIELDISDKEIIFKNVSFSYTQEHELLQDVSFVAKPNETIAFVGPSGSGKSTLFALIERFYDINAGSIMVGDYKIQDLSLKSWRSQLGYVPQESSMFAGTIRENLVYGLDYEVSDDKIWEVLQLACAKEFVEEMPERLDSIIGERGQKLSGGQRQRIAIARAFLRNPKVLLLDEATASLDSQSEAIVQQALNNLMKGRTTFVIAHRLSTITGANQIVFLDGGKVTGIGTHQQLLAEHELYHEFATHQFV